MYIFIYTYIYIYKNTYNNTIYIHIYNIYLIKNISESVKNITLMNIRIILFQKSIVVVVLFFLK